MSNAAQPANFLVSSAGRRGELVKILKEVADAETPPGCVFAVDRSHLSSAGWLSDGLDLVPAVLDPGFLARLKVICQRRGVRHLIPTIDTELPVFSEAREELATAGVNVWVSDASTIAIARDKRATNRWLLQNGFPAARQYELKETLDNSQITLPLLAKPATGSSSIGIRRIEQRADLHSLNPEIDYVLEEIVTGSEFTVDVLVDRQGRCRQAVPRERLEVRAGEVSKGRTVHHPRLVALARNIAEALPGAYGILNVQVMVDGETLKVIEINARFGGGFPLTWAAGSKMPLWIAQEDAGLEPTAPLDWKADQYMLRYDAMVVLDGTA